MALPTRGQPDWDDEMGNHISNLEADVQSAVANASAAISAANSARNRADAVHTAVLGDFSTAVAEALPTAFAAYGSVEEAEIAYGAGAFVEGAIILIDTGA